MSTVGTTEDGKEVSRKGYSVSGILLWMRRAGSQRTAGMSELVVCFAFLMSAQLSVAIVFLMFVVVICMRFLFYVERDFFDAITIHTGLKTKR